VLRVRQRQGTPLACPDGVGPVGLRQTAVGNTHGSTTSASGIVERPAARHRRSRCGPDAIIGHSASSDRRCCGHRPRPRAASYRFIPGGFHCPRAGCLEIFGWTRQPLLQDVFGMADKSSLFPALRLASCAFRCATLRYWGLTLAHIPRLYGWEKRGGLFERVKRNKVYPTGIGPRTQRAARPALHPLLVRQIQQPSHGVK